MADYSNSDLPFATAIVNGIISDKVFRHWFFSELDIGASLTDAEVLAEEQRSLRSSARSKERWWFNYWAGSGPGIETDILLLFQTSNIRRIAIHIEVNDAKGGLIEGQAGGYCRHSVTWSDPRTRPNFAPPHDTARTILVAGRHVLYDPRSKLFNSIRLHDEISRNLRGYPR